jgi:hypothetical protein
MSYLQIEKKISELASKMLSRVFMEAGCWNKANVIYFLSETL